MLKNFDCVVYMIPLEDGLNQMQWKRLNDFFHYEDELIPIEVSSNNTTMMGFVKNIDDDMREECMSELIPIADDWQNEPENGELITESGYKIKILCDFETLPTT